MRPSALAAALRELAASLPANATPHAIADQVAAGFTAIADTIDAGAAFMHQALSQLPLTDADRAELGMPAQSPDRAAEEKAGWEALAARAYAGYSAKAGGVTFDGKPLPTWSELGDDRQGCWVAAVQAVFATADTFNLRDAGEL